MKKEFTNIDFLTSCFFNVQQTIKIPFDRSGKAVLELPHSTITFYKQKKKHTKKTTCQNGLLTKNGSKAPDVAGQSRFYLHGSEKWKPSIAELFIEAVFLVTWNRTEQQSNQDSDFSSVLLGRLCFLSAWNRKQKNRAPQRWDIFMGSCPQKKNQ